MSRKTYYVTCPYCLANLDPGERCDCQARERRKEREIEKLNLKVAGFRGRLYDRKIEKR